ncbi:MAG: molybdopterin-dependent oxidoreductase [Planctomycetaceae bacterium]|nr:molybdopterin-dependent oxidoreductase [Planctomycetales bacterium]MCB9941731.1 molybdopterin-dependent oxidoreductase [Planctomycetaceae bacterium]
MDISRRRFLETCAASGGALLAVGPRAWAFDPVNIENPLGAYPNRDWEKIYLDQYSYDDTFTWICAPNDTHMCRLRAFVRNGVMIRSEQNYDHDRCGDLYGNAATKAWNPRGCPKGFTMQRRVYGPYRLKGPVLRKGWKEWADAGFPSLSDTPELRTKYKFDDRGNDSYVRMSWQEVARYVAGGLEAVSRTYSGDEGVARLRKDGYEQAMIDRVEGAGTRTIKVGSNLPIHGLVGKFGIYRLANLLGLLDHHVRGVAPEDARGARDWNEYTWRGDQAPGHPFVHGLQTSDMDFNDMRFCKLVIQIGKNLIENKMPESHWLNECMERGAKLVDIAPEYNCPATKSDYWISVRPGLSDLAVLLCVTKIMLDNNWYKPDFCRQFTDFPLLVRPDTLERLRPQDVQADYQLKDISGGPSYQVQGLNDEQRAKIGDFCVWDADDNAVAFISRDDVGNNMRVNAALEGTFQVKLADGSEIEVIPIMEMYRRHLQDYDEKTVEEISGAPAHLVRRLAKDIWETTEAGHPVAIHIGEGVNHYFHATLHNRATYLPLMLTGNIGKHGAGSCTWAGNYKGALFQASSWSGPGVGSFTNEDPFNPVLDEAARITHENLRHTTDGEDPSYWACGEKTLTVDLPNGQTRNFTGHTHMPTPTKVVWYNNANFLNQAKWIYNIIANVLPQMDMIVDQQIEWTGSAEYSDVVLPVNSWVEMEDYECGGSCSNPFLQVWKGGIKPVHDTVDDAEVFALVARAFTEKTGDQRFADYFKFVTEKKAKVYIQRVFDNSTTTRGKDGPYSVDKMIAGDYGGEPGAALMLFRTYPRVPFYEQIHDSIPFYTDSGRMHSYCDIPEAIEFGENMVVHREGVEATPYLPNVIVSTSPFVRPVDFGIPLDTIDPDLRQVRNVKMSWEEAKKTVNPLWSQGYAFFCCTPKSRHSTHSSWTTVDWHWIWSDNFGDPHRTDKRSPGVADRQIQINPQAAKDQGLNEGDYVWVDANELDRPYLGWKDDQGPRHKAFRCMVRVKVNPGLPYNFTIMKHTGWIASERSVKAHETRPDGRALAAETGYQASYRYGSHQSITRNWMMPMHQTDTLFHKKTGAMGFTFGFDVDNHAINTVPKETLIRITKAEDGGIGGVGIWKPAKSGYSPSHESAQSTSYLAGGYVQIRT